MRRHFVWSEGFGAKGYQWLSVCNVSATTMNITIKLRTDAGKEHQQLATLAPMSRFAWNLTDIVEKSHFMTHVVIDQMGSATLTCWEQSYNFPPFSPPPSIYDEAVGIHIAAAPPQPK